MNRLGELVPSEGLLAFLEKLETACSNITSLEEKFTRLERAFIDLRENVASKHPVKELYTPAQVAALLGKRPYTVRELCRLGRVKAGKGTARYGCEQDWRISHEEVMRYQNEGLLPRTPLANRR